MVARAFRFRIRRAIAFAAFLLAFLPLSAQAEPAFGDSDWVAPGWEDKTWYEAACDTCTYGADSAGPRVAKPDKDPTGETILRAPFRLLFLPVRLLARGSERLIGWVGPSIGPSPEGGPKPPWSFEPVVTADPSLGIGVTRRLDPYGKSRIQLSAIYGFHDRRRAHIVYSSARDTARFGMDLGFHYRYRPDTRFYGVGNFSSVDNKSYWLGEEGVLNGTVRLGHAIRHEVRLLGSLNSMSARSGYSGPPTAQRTELVFTPEEVPFLLRGSFVYSVGLAGDLATLDDVRTPRRGIHLRGEASQIGSLDNSNLDYRRYRVDVRGYVPVFTHRQSFALRALHDWVDTAPGSEAVPYYRLPESADDQRFKGYRTHRFTDQHYVLGELEYRWWLSNKFYALLNASIGEVASTASRLRWDDHHESYGTGFRYGYSDRLVGRFDAGFGSEGLVMHVALEDTF